jgi:hypothetical protein
MSEQTAILSLPLIMPSQAQKHVTHNEALRILDMAVQLAVTNRTRTTPPASPVVGDRYIVDSGATGVWNGRENQIAVFTADGWDYIAPQAGWQAYVTAEDGIAVFNGAAWVIPSAGAPDELPLLGINATANTTNRLTVSAPATLLNHDGAGHQLKLNKAAAGETASLLFQTGFSGRAEMGTMGSNAFSIKVSNDGSAFATALTASAPNGYVSLPGGVLANGFALRDSSDPTKTASFNLSGLASGATRSYSLPDHTGEMALLSGAQTFTGAKDFAAKVQLAPANAGGAGLNIAPGTAPTAPVNGDLWTTATGVFAQVNGLTLQLDNAALGTDLAYAPTTRLLSSSNGTDVILPLAGPEDGLMAAADKAKLDGLPAAAQPLDGDLVALAALTGTDTLYYRNGPSSWAPVTIGANLSFASGTLAAAGGGAGLADGDKGDVVVAGGGSNWTVTAASGDFAVTGAASAAMVGINAPATSQRRLSVAAVETLLTHDGAGHSLKINKSGAAAAAIMQFQSANTPRAELGLNGSNDFSLRVSPDGNTWQDGLTIASDGAIALAKPLTLAATPTPTPPTPPAGQMALFARTVAGRMLPAVVGPTGLDSTLQPLLGTNRLGMFLPNGNSTTATSFGIAYSTSGTATAHNFTATNRYGRMRGLEYLVATAATTAVAGFRGTAAQWTVGGTNPGDGGFLSILRWAPATGVSTPTHRAFAGMGSATTPTDVQPSSLLNILGMGWDAADANIQFLHNDATGTATKIDLGPTFPVPTTDRTAAYEIALFSPQAPPL